MDNILIDTGFWFALYNPKDQYHKNAIDLTDFLSLANILIPYPTLYETINTTFTEDKRGFIEFRKLLAKNNFTLIDDSSYRNEVDILELTYNSAIISNRPLSLVDMVIRLILSDETMRIKYLVTFNSKDFADVCQKRNIQILNC
jgi:predicted nucleic acid-binding protein